MKNILKKFIFLFTGMVILFGFGNICFSQTYPSAPETLQEVKEMGEQMIQKTPESLKEAGEEAVSIWKRMWLANKHWIKIAWDKLYSFLNTEVEKRKPEAKQEFEKEVEELKKEAPSLWQRFKELIKK